MKSILRPMLPRAADEPHRAATPLELLFDLVSVIAIAAAAAGLHHAIAENHALEGIITFLMAFFAIWWAWMNYTWFASAYDNDDAVFRLLTMLIMAGALVMAAGIPQFAELDFRLGVGGYVIMRIGMVALWLRAARHDRKRRTTTLIYGFGILLVQAFWVLFLLAPPSLVLPLFILGVILELSVPVIAERQSNTTWHRHHIIERYGLLNIIVLGETLLAGSIALQQASNGEFNIALVHIALSALVILFSMWWLYFAREDHLDSHDLNRALVWGYGHFVVYASGAAVGAGFAVLVDIVTGHSEISLKVGDYAVATPVTLYMLGLWFVRDRFCLSGAAKFVLPVFAVLVLIVPIQPLALEGIAALTVLSVFVRSRLAARQAEAHDQA